MIAEKNTNAKENNNYSKRIMNIVQRITSAEIKVVSFDIFDTLLFRPVMQPTEIFGLIGAKLGISNFRDKRIAAEAEARKKSNLAFAWEDITFEEIYSEYGNMFDCTEDEIRAIMKEELAAEYQLLYPRKTAKFLFDTAIKAGKEIIIVSDMYLPYDFLKDCLYKNGYTGYSNLYLSCLTRKSKGSGNMYKFVLGDMNKRGIMPNEIIHIGDNARSDIANAKKCGINAEWLPKPVELIKDYPKLRNYDNYFMTKSYNTQNCMLYGMLINNYFDDPFIIFDKNSMYNGNAKLLGKWLTPFMLGMTKWLIEQCEDEKIEQFIFVMRDGFIPLKIFEKMRPYMTKRDMDVTTIYMGRTLRLPFSASKKDSLFDSIVYYDVNPKTTVEEFAKERLYIDDPKQLEEVYSIFYHYGYLGERVPLGKFNSYRGIIPQLQTYFTANASQKEERYRKYISSIIDSTKKIAFFDRSPRGFSASFLYEYFGINSICYSSDIFDIPTTNSRNCKFHEVKGYVNYGRKYQERMGWVSAFIIERIISDTHPGFADVKENDDSTMSVVLDNKTSEERSDKLICEIQDGIVEFSSFAVDLFGDYLKYLFIDSNGVFDQITEFLINPSKKDANLILRLTPDESSVTSTDKDIFKKWYDMKINAGKPINTVPPKTPFSERLRIWGYYKAEKMGILPQARGIYHRLRDIYRKFFGKTDKFQGDFSADRLRAQINKEIKHAQDIAKYCSAGNNVFFAGEPLKSAFSYIEKLSKMLPQYDFISCTSNGWRRSVSASMPNVMIFSRPEYLNISHRYTGKDFSAGNISECVSQFSVELLKAVGNDDEYCRLLASEQERYYSAIFSIFQPKVVIVWNAFAFNSHMVKLIAEKNNIPVITMESGHLEGTFIFSDKLYGDDSITREAIDFKNKLINADQLDLSRKIIARLAEQRSTRYVQNTFNISLLPKQFKKDRKTVLFIGQFDIENYSFPYEDESGKHYSPVFSSSDEGVKYMAKIAAKNNWNLIYKPHPLTVVNLPQKKLPSNVCVVNADVIDLIELSDVVVCMLSGLAYTTLIYNKPLVELCVTPLYNKGCCYEAFTQSDIESQVNAAMTNGYTDDQKLLFDKHVAQLCDYYYDNQMHPELLYGKTLSQAADLIDNLAKR